MPICCAAAFAAHSSPRVARMFRSMDRSLSMKPPRYLNDCTTGISTFFPVCGDVPKYVLAAGVPSGSLGLASTSRTADLAKLITKRLSLA